MHSFEVHSNESACRKSGCLGLEQVLGMTCYPFIYIKFDIIIDFWMPFSFWFIGPQAINNFHGSVFAFCSSNTTFCCFLFNIKYVGEKTQWFPGTWFFYCCFGHRQTRTFVCDFLCSRHHSSIYNIL